MIDFLQQYIQSLTKEEIRAYKLFALRSNDNEERKDILLFDLYKKSKNIDDEKFFKKLYEGSDKNAYYRLKNRLQEDIGTSLLLLYAEKKDTSELFKHLSLYQLFYDRQFFQLALSHLKKAERKAVQSENFELLDLVYANFIRLSNDILELNPESYLALRKANALELNKIRSMDQLLAALNFRLRRSQNYAGTNTSLLKIAEKTFKEYQTDNSIKENKNYQTRIYKAISQVLVQQHNFKELEQYALEALERFEQYNWFDKWNHELQLQMLIYIVNAKFYNQKHKESIIYAEKLGKEILAYEKLHYEKYLFFYYNSLVVNYAHTDFDKALAKLDEFERLMRKRKNNFYDQFIYLNRATLLFEVKKFDAAIRNLHKLYVSPSYASIDKAFQLKIEVAELIIWYESKDIKGLEKRIEQVRKNNPLLKQKEFSRETKLISIISNLLTAPKVKNNDMSVTLINKFLLNKTEISTEESEVINYNQWLLKLIEKFKKTPLDT